jgi:hypothetical protein
LKQRDCGERQRVDAIVHFIWPAEVFDALSLYAMDLSVHRAVLLGIAVASSCVCCATLLDYGDLSFEDTHGKSPWSPVDGASVYEVSNQDVPPPLKPECEQSSLALVGNLEGTKADQCYAMSWHTIDQSTSPASVELEFGTEGKVHLEWTGLISDGVSTPAKGTLKMPAEGPSGGKTYCVDDGTFAMFELDLGVRAYVFSLTKLSSGATCPGTAAQGSVQGDYRTQ